MRFEKNPIRPNIFPGIRPGPAPGPNRFAAPPQASILTQFPHLMKKLAALLFAFVFASAAFAAEKFPDISHDELVKAIKEKKVTLIDVNGTDSYKSGHIPGAIDFDTAGKNLAAKLPADKNALVVAYCGNEMCTAYVEGAKAAKALGYKNVKHYAKGIQGWKAAGEKTE